MRRSIILFTVIFLSIGCSRKEPVTSPRIGGFDLNEYIPLIVDNSWTYSNFTVNTAGLSDTSWSSPIVLSIFQTNVLIGGQPNAFIVRTDDRQGHVSYLAFCINGKTMLHYLGAGSTFPVEDNIILWVPGGFSGAVVGSNQTQKYHIADLSGSSKSFSLMRPPDPSIALAMMTSPDTVQIKGVSIGQTTLTLKMNGGTPADTMSVLIATINNPPSSLASPFPPWIPLWQLTSSSSDETMFSRDTTYTFKCIFDSAECRDELHYLFTNRHVGDEIVPALNMSLHCDRFQMKITVIETITYTDKVQTRLLFAGPSTEYTIDAWLAKDIGFVKEHMNGNSRSPVAIMGGSQDKSGVLNGYYISPRVTYASIPDSLTSDKQYFHVDDTPLGASPLYNGFILVQKNF